MACIKQTIGITKDNCDCYEQLNADLLKSDSGYYLHELAGVQSIETVEDIVECSDLSNFYEKVLDGAGLDLMSDLSAQLSERYTRREIEFVGFMGSRSHSRTLDINQINFGLKITPVGHSDGILLIKSISVAFNVTQENFDVLIYRYYRDTEMIELVDTIEGVSSVANSLATNGLDTPIQLPLSLQGEGRIDYYLVLDKAGKQPRNTATSCGCGSKEKQLLNMVSFKGVQGNDIANIDGWSEDSAHTNGIVLNVEVRCDSENFICKMKNENESWRQYFAQALLYKSAYQLHKRILSSNQITQAILSNRENMENNMREFENEYWERIRYLVQNVDLSKTSCYSCGRGARLSRILT